MGRILKLDHLIDALVRARLAVGRAYLDNSKIKHTGVDYDHYVYLIIEKKQRSAWDMLVQLEKVVPWLKVDRDTGMVDIAPETVRGGIYAKNGEASAARAAASVLCSSGIAARVEERWR